MQSGRNGSPGREKQDKWREYSRNTEENATGIHPGLCEKIKKTQQEPVCLSGDVKTSSKLRKGRNQGESTK